MGVRECLVVSRSVTFSLPATCVCGSGMAGTRGLSSIVTRRSGGGTPFRCACGWDAVSLAGEPERVNLPATTVCSSGSATADFRSRAFTLVQFLFDDILVYEQRITMR